MALGVDGMRAGKVVRKALFLTFGTALFVFCLTLVYESMRAVMDVGGACASGGAYQIRQQCPDGVAWVMPVDIFGMCFAGVFTFLGVFPNGGPRPYVFAWSALFLALGWNFLDYGFDAPGGGTEVGWLVCGFIFVAMGGVPLLFLLSPRAAHWSLWGPDGQRGDDHLHPYKPPPVRAPQATTSAATSSAPYARPNSAPVAWSSVPVTTVSTVAQRDPAGNGDVVERLATLADLRERGMLDDDEYERAKRAVLDEDAPS
jgi:hypothetical protein